MKTKLTLAERGELQETIDSIRELQETIDSIRGGLEDLEIQLDALAPEIIAAPSDMSSLGSRKEEGPQPN